jgi:hypothetical protein
MFLKHQNDATRKTTLDLLSRVSGVSPRYATFRVWSTRKVGHGVNDGLAEVGWADVCIEICTGGDKDLVGVYVST